MLSHGESDTEYMHIMYFILMLFCQMRKNTVKMAKMKPQMGQNHFTNLKNHCGPNFSIDLSFVSKVAIEITSFEEIAQKMCLSAQP